MSDYMYIYISQTSQQHTYLELDCYSNSIASRFRTVCYLSHIRKKFS